MTLELAMISSLLAKQETKIEINKLEYFETKHFCASKDTINRRTR
jgi:hypothetical protein